MGSLGNFPHARATKQGFVEDPKVHLGTESKDSVVRKKRFIDMPGKERIAVTGQPNNLCNCGVHGRSPTHLRGYRGYRFAPCNATIQQAQHESDFAQGLSIIKSKLE